MSTGFSTRLLRSAMVFVACLAACLAAGATPAGAQPAATSPVQSSPTPSKSAFTAEQRTEIVSIVRDALKQDPSILRDAVAAMQADEASQQAATASAAIVAQHAALSDPAAPSAGNPKGDVTIVEFFDTRCPYCRKLDPTMAQFLAQDPNVKLVFKDLPILGPQSLLGSKALLAAERQGGYDKLRTAIMQSPPDITLDQIRSLAENAGLSWTKMQKDMDDPAIQQRLDANLKLAKDLGIEGTPALVIGTQLIPGAVEVADLSRAVADARTAKN
jgi:protein-disulfide isomerase